MPGVPPPNRMHAPRRPHWTPQQHHRQTLLGWVGAAVPRRHPRQQVAADPAAPVLSLPCDRCGWTFEADKIEPLCAECAEGGLYAEVTGGWERPMTVQEFKEAARQARRRGVKEMENGR